MEVPHEADEHGGGIRRGERVWCTQYLFEATHASLLRASKGLLAGESADSAVLDGMRRIIAEEACVLSTGRLLMMHVGPNAILVNMDLDFSTDLKAQEITQCVDRPEKRILHRHPDVRNIFIGAQSLARSGRRRCTTVRRRG